MSKRLRRHVGMLIVGGVFVALAAGAPAIGSGVVSFAKRAGNADSVNGIQASRTPRAGMLVPLGANKKLPASVAPAGRRGLPGTAGPAGAAGAQGADGAPGPQGATGPAGERDATEAAGADGAPGAQGADGATGPQGADGANGPQGAPGPQGADGEPGDDGAPGATGPQGPPGAQGNSGPAGAAGPAGPAGPQGAVGPTGPQGPAGTPAVYQQLVDVNPILRPSASHRWDTVRTNSPSWFGTYRASDPTGDATSYLEWKLPLEAGSWEIEVVYAADLHAGVMTFSLDGADFGSIDAYDPGTEFNEVRVLTTAVGASGIHTLKVRTDQTNAPSGSYYGYLTWIRLVRL